MAVTCTLLIVEFLPVCAALVKSPDGSEALLQGGIDTAGEIHVDEDQLRVSLKFDPVLVATRIEGGFMQVLDIIDGLAVELGDNQCAESFISQCGRGRYGPDHQYQFTASLLLIHFWIGICHQQLDRRTGLPVIAKKLKEREGEFLENEATDDGKLRSTVEHVGVYQPVLGRPADKFKFNWLFFAVAQYFDFQGVSGKWLAPHEVTEAEFTPDRVVVITPGINGVAINLQDHVTCLQASCRG